MFVDVKFDFLNSAFFWIILLVEKEIIKKKVDTYVAWNQIYELYSTPI